MYFHYTVNVGVYVTVFGVVVERERTQLVPVAPEFIQLVEIVAARRILALAGIVQFEWREHPHKVGVDIGPVASCGNIGRAGGYVELLLLIGETLYENK